MGRYRLYLDESGDHAISHTQVKDWDKRHLCIFGCAFDLEYCHDKFCASLETLKRKHFGGDRDDCVILHLEGLRAKSGFFAPMAKKENADAFWNDFATTVQDAQFRAFAVLIDKISASKKRYGPIASHPYHVGLLTILERYCGFLRFYRHTGDVMAESRGGKEDGLLKAAYVSVYNGGTYFRPKDFFQSTLTSKELKIKKKETNVSGLQLADMFALPARRRLLFECKRAPRPNERLQFLGDLVEPKYNRRYGTDGVAGYGKVLIL